MFCTNCGAENSNNETNCQNCGTPLAAQANNSTAYEQSQSGNIPNGNNPYVNVNINRNFDVNNIPEEYRPISMWGFVGYQFLFGLPCIGFILLIVFALGGTKNINLKNFARSHFIVYLVWFILFIALFVLFGSSLATALYYYGYY